MDFNLASVELTGEIGWDEHLKREGSLSLEDPIDLWRFARSGKVPPQPDEAANQ
jgi:hypothetical protein